MSTPNPLDETHVTPPAKVSSHKYVIAGILTTVYGLDELASTRRNVSCLWLLHPRLATQHHMTPLASTMIGSWNRRLEQSTSDHAPGLLAISFDQRNHGSREIEPLANRAWREGGKKHAQDMFSAYHGTALDCSQLITYLSSYIFSDDSHVLSSHMALGVSLGGHCVWHCILQDPRITTGVVVIGCPDYVSLMTDRARLSKRKSWTDSSPPGSRFIGSVDFPPGLVEAVEKYDPAGLFLGNVAERTEESYTRDLSEEDKKETVALMNKTLQGKRILNLSGGADKLVPYARGEAFINWLKKVVGRDGCFSEGGVVFEDMVFDGVGHTMSPKMVEEAVRFICQSLELWEPSSDRSSKI